MINSYQANCQARVDAALEPLFEAPTKELERLYAAMRYSVMNGGKRVRPLLAYAACEALGAPAEQANGAACAVELIHAYSLVHDDLPAMDDDDLRRGQPTTHKAFDEACAILAGDGLQSLAFSALLDTRLSPQSDTLRLAMVQALAKAAGPAGMVGGQAIDLGSVGIKLDQQALEFMHRHKTGALIEASVRLGALASARAEQAQLDALQTYAQAIGLAFQVQDDILDVESDTATLGKRQGADIARDKPTYPALLGLEAAKAYAIELRDQALVALQGFGENAEPLRALARYIVERRN
ncbi:(2E,6E)-farnesyl diphosphate synthase [Pseudomonas sp. P1B16]|jgi:geranylgeranyl diphosphate synthase type II|uniref:(2E,6E)-farnesyl diphosphate synthase n=1 Tax=Pseudomonas capeferrum TaxID=1495066 RepID=A0ABY7RB87_9PSED|nr:MULTISPECIES: farnesyl diphosphate synthase [Pseudomonas]KEY84872.1 geranyl transferase [Pseudomonas capeferrum]MBC3483543.1 (2E,6E)-farnesyl diphosphate synthase [Pseudomonas sp. SWRI77]MBC3502989.1 (2E,6E)-farnesyl diphosphate synthase [Pseudomonas sp. SWRI59]MBC3509208.1 (2E,6E)-farnesyl diphosphate synthase [Pseudomonas sp. SWRI68]MCH7298590.1 (2E,6E)-farnesyl diphosphate synthase [Pseudomonas capeferrum]